MNLPFLILSIIVAASLLAWILKPEKNAEYLKLKLSAYLGIIAALIFVIILINLMNLMI